MRDQELKQSSGFKCVPRDTELPYFRKLVDSADNGILYFTELAKRISKGERR